MERSKRAPMSRADEFVAGFKFPPGFQQWENDAASDGTSDEESSAVMDDASMKSHEPGNEDKDWANEQQDEEQENEPEDELDEVLSASMLDLIGKSLLSS